MSMSDPLGDMLARIRNAQMRRKETVLVPVSKLRARVLDVFASEGYLRSYKVIAGSEVGSPVDMFEIRLKYFDDRPVIRKLSRISKPGRRVYVSVKDGLRVAGGLGVAVLSTSRGVMSDYAAREARVGGEVLCQIF